MSIGDEDLNNKIKFVIAIVIGALIISVIFNVHYYVNVRIENKNVLHNMRARALASYSGEVVTVANFLEEYLKTLDHNIIDKQVSWGIARAVIEADICTQGVIEDSAPLYYELRKTARSLENYFVHELYGPINATKVKRIVELLYETGSPFAGFDLLKNEDPLENLYNSDVNTVINNCRQIQEIVKQ